MAHEGENGGDLDWSAPVPGDDWRAPVTNAGDNGSRQASSKGQRAKGGPDGGCYQCGGPHLARDCPDGKGGRGGKSSGKRGRGGDHAQREGDGEQKTKESRKGKDHGKGGGKRGRDRENEEGEVEGDGNRSGKGGRGGKDRREKDRGGKEHGGKGSKRNGIEAAGEDEAKKDDWYADRNGRGDKDRGGKNSRGGKGHGGKQQSRNNDAPMLLGSPISAALPGLPAALGAPKQCVLCRTDGPTYVALGPCGHAHACWVCTLRLRALGHDKCCPMCREEASEVLITNDARTSFPSKRDHLPCDSDLGVLFADSAIQHNVMRLFEYRCRFQQCKHASVAFATLKELQDHLWWSHWRQFCGTCLHGRSSFICEQVIYSSNNFHQHCRWGDKAQSIGGREMPAIAPHSWCEFCKEWFFDEDLFHYHMHSKHHLCAICEKMGQRNNFYSNFRCLARHYSEEHFVCAHRDCCHSGHRLTVFASEMELEMHRLREHADRAQLTEKEKKQTFTVGVSYAETNRTTGKGGSRGNQAQDDFTIRFCWPKDKEWATKVDDDEDDEQNAAETNRYPERDVFSDHGEEPIPSPEIVESEGDSDEGEDDDEDDEDDNDEDPNQLCKKLRPVLLQATVASTGRQEGLRCCLDALQAVLRALLPGPPALPDANLDALRSAVGCLNGVELETFDKMRKDLARIGGASSDWEPLERVLALRPNFFRLFRSVKGTGIGPSIGPKSGTQPSKSDDTSEELWYAWKLAAQTTIRSLGREEQQYLRAYIHFCIERRKVLHSSNSCQPSRSADEPKVKAALEPTAEVSLVPVDTSEEFPTLGSTPGVSQPGRANAEPSWGARQPKQAVPKMAAAKVETTIADAWDTSPCNNEKAIAECLEAVEEVEEFPSLVPSSSSKASGRQAAPKAMWAPDRGQPRGNSTLPQNYTAPPKASAKPKASPPTAMDFPTLGGGSSTAASKANEWAQARERSEANKAKKAAEIAKPPKPEPPKDFQGIQEGLFPSLPASAPKSKSSTAKASQSAKAKMKSSAKAKLKAVGTDSSDNVVVLPESVFVEPEEQLIELVPDSQLVLIHEPCDPLDAVARSQAAEAERRERKTKKKTGIRGAVVNPWTAGSPTLRRG